MTSTLPATPSEPSTRRPGVGTTSTLRGRGVAVPLVLVYVLALGGRYTLGRAGLQGLEEFDLRFLGAPVVAIAVLVWRLHPRWTAVTTRVGAPASWAVAVMAWLGLAALWAPVGSPIGDRLTDVIVLAVLITATAVLLAPDPERGALVLLWSTLLASAAYTVIGLTLQQTDVQGRLTALGGGPNVYARVVALGIVAAVALSVLTGRRWLLVLTPFMALAVVLSGSRGSIVAAAVTTLFFLVVFRRGRALRRTVLLAAALVLCVVVGVSILGGAAENIVRTRAGSIFSADYSSREDLIAHAWPMFTAHPLIGSGLGSFWPLYGRTVQLDYPHNMALDLAATGGLVALALVLGFVVSVFRACRPVTSLDTARTALLLASVFVLIESFFSGDIYDTRFFFIYAVAAAAGSTARARSASR